MWISPPHGGLCASMMSQVRASPPKLPVQRADKEGHRHVNIDIM